MWGTNEGADGTRARAPKAQLLTIRESGGAS